MQAEKVLMKSPDEALCHLFFYCCSKDGVFGTSEINFISSMFVDLGLNKQLNFKDEMLKYRSYSNDIQDENGYLQDLIQVIRPVNESALFSYCVEVMLSDDLLSESETVLLNRIAEHLGIDAQQSEKIQRLMIQRKAVATEKIV